MQTLVAPDCPACNAVGTIRGGRCTACGASVARPGTAPATETSSGYLPRIQLDEDFDPIPVTAHLGPSLDAIHTDAHHRPAAIQKAILAILLTALIGVAVLQILKWQSPPASAFVQSFQEKTFQAHILNGEPEQTWVAYFWSPQYSRCREFIPVFNAAAEKLQDTASFARVRLEQAPEVAKKFDVTFVPALLVFRGGEVIARTQGYLNDQELIDWLKVNLIP
ncbi:MAG: thioredoxin family protein [Candidatus Sumerlaeaceae bacterium]